MVAKVYHYQRITIDVSGVCLSSAVDFTCTVMFSCDRLKYLPSANGSTSDRPQISHLALLRHGKIRCPVTVLMAAKNTMNVTWSRICLSGSRGAVPAMGTCLERVRPLSPISPIAFCFHVETWNVCHRGCRYCLVALLSIT